MSVKIELHVAGTPIADGSDCARCGCVLGGRGTAFVPSTLVVLTSGHYSSARMATPDDLRTGVLCEAKPATVATVVLYGLSVTLTRLDGPGGIIRVSGIANGPVILRDITVDEAKALAQALRQCIGELDTAAQLREATRTHGDIGPRPTEMGAP